MTTMRYALGWLLATVLVSLAAWWVVAAASDEVNEVSAAPLIDPTTSTSAATGSSSPGSTPGSSTTSPANTTSSSSPTSTTFPQSSTSSSSPGTTAPTTTTTSNDSGVETINSAGGTVTVSYGNGQVFLEAATPAIGYKMEVEDTGPSTVRVDFEAENSEVSVRVEWKDGKLDIEIED